MSCLSISLSVLFSGVHRRAGPARPHRRLPRRHARRRQPTGEEKLQVVCRDDGSLKCGFKAEVKLHIRTYFAMIFHNHNWMITEMAARVFGCGK